MFNKNHGLVLLTLLLLLVSVSSVCAADNNTGSLTTVKDNDSVYGCGVVAFQTALEYNDVNISLEEAEKATNTVNGSTSMQGLIEGAEKYNLSAVGAVIKAEDLKTGYIVHMNIDNTGHWAVIEDVTEYVNLNDISDDLILPLDEFKKYYTNKTVIISNDPILLSSLECDKIIGNAKFLNSIKKYYNKHFNVLKKKKNKHSKPKSKWYKHTTVKKAKQYRIKNWKLQHRDFSLKKTYAHRKKPYNPYKRDKRLLYREYGVTTWHDGL